MGANGLPLINDGNRGNGCYDPDRLPRTAICVNQQQSEMVMMVIDGRRWDAPGMTCDEVRDLAEEFNCWDAAMLDGGGSSTMWVDGAVRNEPSDGQQRVRPNHFGVVINSQVDPQCPEPSQRWCDGNLISTCSGGRFLGEGDCASLAPPAKKTATGHLVRMGMPRWRWHGLSLHR